jgi:Fic family protein
MVSIKKKKMKNRTYYYLEHSIWVDGNVRKKEKYLGPKLPKNIDELKKAFLFKIYEEKWYPLFDKIKKNYSKELKKMAKVSKEKEMESFMIKFTYDTQRIEGSTLTLRETADLLERDITPKAKSLVDVKKAEAHKKVFYEMLQYEKDLSYQIMLYWHKMLFEPTKSEIAGKIRQHQVTISGSKFTPPLPVEIYPLLRAFFKWYNKNKNKIHTVAIAGLVHLKFVTIHPFADGNGRIARIMQNFVLTRYGYPMLNITFGNRTSYYNALERSQVKEDENIFLQWFFRRYKKEYQRYLSD